MEYISASEINWCKDYELERADPEKALDKKLLDAIEIATREYNKTYGTAISPLRVYISKKLFGAWSLNKTIKGEEERLAVAASHKAINTLSLTELAAVMVHELEHLNNKSLSGKQVVAIKAAQSLTSSTAFGITGDRFFSLNPSRLNKPVTTIANIADKATLHATDLAAHTSHLVSSPHIAAGIVAGVVGTIFTGDTVPNLVAAKRRQGNEYRCDAVAAEVMGPEVTAGGLESLKKVDDSIASLNSESSSLLQRIATSFNDAKARAFDSHPPFQSRIDRVKKGHER